MPRIIVKIRKGTAQIEAEGFAGANCLRATERVSRALGTTLSDAPTNEMYLEAGVDSKVDVDAQ